ncbi:MAG: hypothetical protein IPP90_22270 [Gemmatimonadaceae bacterium]|nr:hypothetical protein [Gemmatimonadaceae bacterium]
MSVSRALSPSLSAAVVTGWIGGAVAWAIASGWTDSTTWLSSYDRIDQLVALTIGACSGAGVLTMRARHRREPLMPALVAGALMGGVGALVAASLGLALRGSMSPRGFVLERMATWSLMAACAAAALSCYSRTRHLASTAESFALGALGGAVAGATLSLPGPTELWWPVAMTWCGAAIGFAAVGPALWRAPIVVQVLPPRDERPSMWSLHECAIEEGWSRGLAESQVGCVDGAVYVYPPPAGAVLNGYPLYRAIPVTRDAILAVGRHRYRLTLRRRA